LTKAAKSAKLDESGNEYSHVTKGSIKEQIDQAIEYFKSGDVPEAKNIIKTVLKEIEKKWDSHGEEDSILLNDCGALLSEIGEEKLAKNALRRSVTISPNSNYEKYITLGQLTSGSESLKYIEAGIEILKKEISKNSGETLENSEKRKLSRAYLNIADLFMTDLCMQNNAQNKCKEAIDQAINADSTNPEGFHTMATRVRNSSASGLWSCIRMWM
jgi:tetratricopeptide (TPR) repeat protein